MEDTREYHHRMSMERVESWTANGLVTTKQVMQRLTMSFKECLSPVELCHFITVFDFFGEPESSKATKVWKENAFRSFLTRPFPPSYSPIADTGKLLYNSALYLASFPFLSEKVSELDFDALLRAAGMFTGLHDGVFNGWGTYDEEYEPKTRDETDRRKFLFQSFATSNPGAIIEKRNPPGDDVNEEDHRDILDVLARTQPGAMRMLTPVSRKSLRVLLKSLPTSGVDEQNLVIPRDEFLALLRLLIVSIQDQAGVFAEEFTQDLHGVAVVANHILTAFIDEEKSITWECFNSTIIHSVPYLLIPLPRLFEPLFKPADPDPPDPPLPTPNPSKILSYPVLSQLCFFLPFPVYVNDLRLLYATHPGPASLSTLISRVLPWQAKSMLLVSGTAEEDPLSGKTRHITYGAFIPDRWQENSTFGSESSLIFKLAPTHSVFRTSGIGTNFAILQSSGIAFGTSIQDTSPDSPPTSLVIDANLAGGVFTIGTTEGTYQASGSAAKAGGRERTGSQRFEIETLEIWGFGPPDDEDYDEE